MDKKIFIGFVVFMACAVSLFFLSQQVTAQAPAKGVKTGVQPPAKDDSKPDVVRIKTPKYAVIDVTSKRVRSRDGEESEVRVYTDKEKDKFLADYQQYSKNAVPLVVKVTLSPTQTYYILTCKIVNGKPLCW